VGRETDFSHCVYKFMKCVREEIFLFLAGEVTSGGGKKRMDHQQFSSQHSQFSAPVSPPAAPAAPNLLNKMRGARTEAWEFFIPIELISPRRPQRSCF